MATLSSLSVLLKGDASDLVRATRTGLGALKKFGAQAGKVLAFGGVGGAAALAGGAAGLVALGEAARASIDAHAKNAARLGLTVEEAQKLALAAGQADLKMRTVNTAMAALTREAGKAAGGSEKAGKKFTALGLSMDEVRGASPFELLQKVLAALKDTENFADRAAKANDLFGESWLKLNPLINAGNQAFADANKIFGELGLGIDGNAESVETFNDKLDSLINLGIALRDKVFAELAPEMANFAAELLDAASAFLKLQGGGAQLARTIGSELVASIRSIIAWFVKLKDGLSGILTVGGFVVDLIQAVGVTHTGLVAAGASVLRGEFSGAGRILGSIPGEFTNQFNDDTDKDQLDETKRQTGILEDIRKSFGPVFQ